MPERPFELYFRLTYDEYKDLEKQCMAWDDYETSHVTVDGYYHKAMRLKVGPIILEAQGPTVKEPLQSDIMKEYPYLAGLEGMVSNSPIDEDIYARKENYTRESCFQECCRRTR